MRVRRPRSLLFLGVVTPAALVAAVLAACVGDDPIPTAGVAQPDAGVDSGPPVDPGDSSTPDVVTDAAKRATVHEVAVGNGFACALLSDQTVMCWGRDDLGQSGQPSAGDVTCDGATPCREPTRVAGLGNIAHVAAGGGSACAIALGTGTVSCWGMNDHGQLGHSNAGESCPGGVPCSRTPVPIAGLSGVAQLAIGATSACSIDETGRVKCWGSNALGELGRLPLGGENQPPEPVPAFDVDGGGATLVAVDSSSAPHYCATRADGSLLCWGRNTAAELGVDAASTPVCAVSERCSSTPLVVNSGGTTVLSSVTSIAAVSGGTCVSVSGGGVWCWGYNGYAVTGPPVSPRLSLPPTLIPGSKLSGLSGGSTHACGLGAGGVPECWGINEYAELGVSPVSTPDASCSGGTLGSRCSFPMQVVSSIHATSVTSNVHTSFAITPDKNLFAWGSNGSGSLGHVPTLAETNNQCASKAPCSPTPVEIVVPY